MLGSIPCLVGNDLLEAESKEMEKSFGAPRVLATC